MFRSCFFIWCFFVLGSNSALGKSLHEKVVAFLRTPDIHGLFYEFEFAHERADAILQSKNPKNSFKAYKKAFSFFRTPDCGGLRGVKLRLCSIKLKKYRDGSFYKFEYAHNHALTISKLMNPVKKMKKYSSEYKALRKADQHGTYFKFEAAHEKVMKSVKALK